MVYILMRMNIIIKMKDDILNHIFGIGFFPFKTLSNRRRCIENFDLSLGTYGICVNGGWRKSFTLFIRLARRTVLDSSVFRS